MIENFLIKLKDNLSKKQVELYQIDYAKSTHYGIDVFDGKISTSSIKEIQNLNLKIKIGSNIGSYSAEFLDEKNIDNIVDTAISNAQLIDWEDESFFHDGSGDYQQVEPYKPLVEKLDKLDVLDFLINLEAQAYKTDSRINKVINTTFRRTTSHYINENSLGLKLSKNFESAYTNIYLSAKENNEIKTGYANTTFKADEDFDIKKIAKTAVDRATNRLGGVNIASKKYNTVFENTAFADLIPLLLNPIYATSLEEKYSKFDGKLEKKVASDVLTLIDNPHLKDGYATTHYDGEGVATQNKNIIENGILKTFLHNLRTAHKYNTKSTGNGASSSNVRCYNTYVLPSKTKKEDILKQAKEGVYITDVIGTHSGYNPVTGDLSFSAEGFVIKDGTINKPINQVVININIYDLLKNITAVGNDLFFEGSQYGSPCVLIKNIAISSQ